MTLSIVARDWQKLALNEWEKKSQGVVAAVTGSGKTTFALLCISRFRATYHESYIYIIVPTTALLDQWYLTLCDDYGVPKDQIGVISGKKKDWLDKPFVLAIINSARNTSSSVAERGHTMLIVDECHRAGSPENAKSLDGIFAATLGLSATPEREHDLGFTERVVPVLGPIIYTYGYKEAFADGVIVPFDLLNIQFDLRRDERHEYDRLTRRIMAKRHFLGSADQTDEILEALLRRRARISWNSPIRVPLAAKLAIQHRQERMIIFHESIPHANEICEILQSRGLRATIYHTHLSEIRRRENLRLYIKGYYSCIVCCRALDEGLNVPGTSIGIIASSTSSLRQRIQRLGRVLRKVPGKEAATIYTLFATEAERRRLEAEELKLEGAASVRWLATKVTYG